MDTRQKNVQWPIRPDEYNRCTWEQVRAAILMDIRDELQKLNRVLACPNFQDIPRKLDVIKRNTTKKRKARKAAQK